MKRTPTIIAALLLVAGVIVVVAGIATWVVITKNLAEQRIIVSSDAACAAGDTVDGPISAFCMAQASSTTP